jgi:hypothetical protein
MRYYRVVLAVKDEDAEKFREYLDCFIETEAIPFEFDTTGTRWSRRAPNPIQGAYVSASYDTREKATHANWIE